MPQVEFQTAATCRTPGTAAIARTAAGVAGAVAEPVVITASPPVACQDAATSPLAIALRSVPAKVATLSASTSANAGSTPVSEVRAAPASATNPVAPACRADSRSRPRMTSGYSRSMTTTARIATSTGAAARNQSTLPPAGTASSCSTTSPATAAAHAVTSATRRRGDASRDRDVSAVITRAGLTAGAGRRCRRAAISDGPASAASTAIPASTQPSTHEALCACPGIPGTSTSARPAPISAAGTAAIAVPRSISPATCRSDPPRARSMVSSSARRTAIVNDATKITAMPTTIMLTNSNRSTVCVAVCVSRNADKSCNTGAETVGLNQFAGKRKDKYLTASPRSSARPCT